MKKKRKGIVAVVIVIAVLLLAVVGYNLYRYPARFHSQTDLSLDEAVTEQLRAEIAVMEDKKVLVAYFLYSGNTRAVAQSLAELTHGDLFEISPREDYSNVYTQSNSEITPPLAPGAGRRSGGYGQLRHSVRRLSGLVARHARAGQQLP